MPEICDYTGAPLRHGRARANGLSTGSANKRYSVRNISIWRKRMSSANKTVNVGFFLARKFLTTASLGAFAWGSVAHAEVSQPAYPKSDLLLVTTVINATNPYMASWIQGSKDLAAKLGVPLQ